MRLLDEPMLAVCVYGPSWMVGFASHDGILSRHRWKMVPLGLVLFAAGLAWFWAGPSSATAAPGRQVDAIALGGYHLGAAMLVMGRRWSDARWSRPLAELARVVDEHTITIFVWAGVMLPHPHLPGLLVQARPLQTRQAILVSFATTGLVLIAAVLLLGRLERGVRRCSQS